MACSIWPVGCSELLPGCGFFEGRTRYQLVASLFASDWKLLCRYRYAEIDYIYAQITNVDADENREIVVNGNYTLAIIRYFLDPDLIFVAIPVIYNICMDYSTSRKNLLVIRALLM
jgi:hypothetical protein